MVMSGVVAFLGKCSTAEKPWGWGMCLYRAVTSTVTMIALGGRGYERDLMTLSKWLVSFFICERRDLTVRWT